MVLGLGVDALQHRRSDAGRQGLDAVQRALDPSLLRIGHVVGLDGADDWKGHGGQPRNGQRYKDHRLGACRSIQEIVGGPRQKGQGDYLLLAENVNEGLHENDLNDNAGNSQNQKHEANVGRVEIELFLQIVNEEHLVGAVDHSRKKGQECQQPKDAVPVENGELLDRPHQKAAKEGSDRAGFPPEGVPSPAKHAADGVAVRRRRRCRRRQQRVLSFQLVLQLVLQLLPQHSRQTLPVPAILRGFQLAPPLPGQLRLAIVQRLGKPQNRSDHSHQQHRYGQQAQRFAVHQQSERRRDAHAQQKAGKEQPVSGRPQVVGQNVVEGAEGNGQPRDASARGAGPVVPPGTHGRESYHGVEAHEGDRGREQADQEGPLSSPLVREGSHQRRRQKGQHVVDEARQRRRRLGIGISQCAGPGSVLQRIIRAVRRIIIEPVAQPGKAIGHERRNNPNGRSDPEGHQDHQEGDLGRSVELAKLDPKGRRGGGGRPLGALGCRVGLGNVREAPVIRNVSSSIVRVRLVLFAGIQIKGLLR
mmetsp:Transcript_16975/g.46633  ORF Transcript_16975/g.46633 Transcript_16975/m.46633 type:complete len:531 (-) Transcript_16975:260-1852(-)